MRLPRPGERASMKSLPSHAQRLPFWSRDSTATRHDHSRSSRSCSLIVGQLRAWRQTYIIEQSSSIGKTGNRCQKARVLTVAGAVETWSRGPAAGRTATGQCVRHRPYACLAVRSPEGHLPTPNARRGLATQLSRFSWVQPRIGGTATMNANAEIRARRVRGSRQCRMTRSHSCVCVSSSHADN